MRRVIGGIVCDTRTATEVATDRPRWATTLYKTGTGDFFIHCIRKKSYMHKEIVAVVPFREDAIRFYEEMPTRLLSYQEAFGEGEEKTNLKSRSKVRCYPMDNGRYTNEPVYYMWTTYDNTELYAEVSARDYYERDGHSKLKAEFLKQVASAGIDAENLRF